MATSDYRKLVADLRFGRGKYDEWMDVRCIPLCDVLNSIPGIATFESCEGHGSKPFRIFFVAESMDVIGQIAEYTTSSAWHLECRWGNGGEFVYFLLEGPVSVSDEVLDHIVNALKVED